MTHRLSVDALAAAKSLAVVYFEPPSVNPWGAYSRDLAFEAVAWWHEISGAFSGEITQLDTVAKERGYPENLEFMPPFTWFAFRWAHSRHLCEQLAAPYIQYARNLAESVARSEESCILHPCGNERGGGQAMLIDVLQSYAAVQAHAGWLSKEDRFFDEATDQYRLYQKILCDSETGLWSQGRGWLDDPDSLSPGAWSRGHGWLMRGLVECLFHMPRGSEGYETMAAILREMAEALRPLRDEEGLWHAMLNLPHDKSPVETSGSALIIHAVACAIALGIFARDEWLKDVRLTTQALQKRISPNGRVLDACKGPGPLNDTHLPDYCHNKPFPPGESHGPGCFLYAFGGLYLLEHPEALSVLMAE